MESVLWFVIIVVAIVQLIMIGKFFAIASDIRSIKNLMINYTEKAKGGKVINQSNDVAEEAEPQPKANNSNLQKQGLIILIIIALGYFSYLVFR